MCNSPNFKIKALSATDLKNLKIQKNSIDQLL